MAMGAGAQLSVTDMRRATRHPVDHRVIGEHRQLGDVHLHITNLSAHGFMSTEAPGLARGERIIRLDDFMKIIEVLQENPRLRRAR